VLRLGIGKPTDSRCPVAPVAGIVDPGPDPHVAFARRDHRSRLRCAYTRVIIEFDLPSPEATYYAPPVTLCKFVDLCFRHFSKNSQLCRLRYDVLSYARQYFRDFLGESWEIWVHGGSGSTIHREPCFWKFFFAGKGGGRFVFRFKVGPRTRCALRFGEGPRVFGFSILISVVVEAFVSNA
jgi:hypothetical protein